MHSTIQAALENAMAGRALPPADALALTRTLADGLLDVMAAARTAQSLSEVRPFTCGIVNAKSGRCQENCAFCAQSARHGTNAPTHPLLSEDELLRHAEALAQDGVNYMGIVISGASPTAGDFQALCRTAERIRRRVDIRLCASFGLLSVEQAGALRQAGFERCHHNLETSRRHYPAVCTSHGFEARVATVENAKRAGLRVCSGGIFGIGETWADRIDLAAELARLEVDSIPVNFLSPIPGTPLGDYPRPRPEEALAVVALYRLMHPRRDIVVCGGRTGLGRYQTLLPGSGANGLMLGDYLTTKGAALADDLELLATLGVRK